jgi:hypothetical protein
MTEAILREATGAFADAFGDRLLAAYALGSLAHGGFSPLVSDVDLGLVLGDPLLSDDESRVAAVADRLKSGGSQLHERLSVFWGTRSTLAGEREGGRFPPLDRLDLLEHGRLLAGSDVRAGLPAPSARELVVAGAEFGLEQLGTASAELRDPDLLLSHGVRRTTKLVLFPVRFLFTAQTGRVATNDAAAAHYVEADAPAKPLVAAALGWRREPPSDPAAARALLAEHLVPLYLHFIDDHRERLAAAGRDDLARAYARWWAQLEPE